MLETKFFEDGPWLQTEAPKKDRINRWRKHHKKRFSEPWALPTDRPTEKHLLERIQKEKTQNESN